MDNKDLFEVWSDLVSPFSTDPKKTVTLFKEIVEKYTEKKRWYHNLNHLRSLLRLAVEFDNKILNSAVVKFSIFYHDVIYKTSRSDNEEKSALLAEKRLRDMNVSNEAVDLVSLFIACTKNHEPKKCPLESDLLYFLDFDLSILGSPNDEYEAYTRAIRKEYSIYPDFLYNKGRKKVIEHFLQKDNVFLTEDFQKRCEVQARQNLRLELATLNE